MSRKKTLTLTGGECFALLRAMANREAVLVDQIDVADASKESLEILGYMHGQLDDLRAARAKFNATGWSEA